MTQNILFEGLQRILRNYDKVFGLEDNMHGMPANLVRVLFNSIQEGLQFAVQ